MRLNDKEDPVFERVPVMSAPLRASVDRMCFQAVFCSKTQFEKHVPLKHRQFFDNYVKQRHEGDSALKEFQARWVGWLEHHEELSDMEDDASVESEDIAVPAAYGAMGSDTESTPDDEGGAQGEGAAAAKKPGKLGQRARLAQTLKKMKK